MIVIFLLICGVIVVNVDVEFCIDVLCVDGCIVVFGECVVCEVFVGMIMFDGMGQYLMFGGIDLYMYMQLLFMGMVMQDDFFIGIVVVFVGGMMSIIDFVIFNLQ